MKFDELRTKFRGLIAQNKFSEALTFLEDHAPEQEGKGKIADFRGRLKDCENWGIDGTRTNDELHAIRNKLREDIRKFGESLLRTPLSASSGPKVDGPSDKSSQQPLDVAEKQLSKTALKEITDSLTRLGDDVRVRVRSVVIEIASISKKAPTTINTPEDLALAVLQQCSCEKLLVRLYHEFNRDAKTLSKSDKVNLQIIIDWLLPCHFDESKAINKNGVVVGAIGTKAMAEVLVAASHHRRTEYADRMRTSLEMVGKLAIQWEEPPRFSPEIGSYERSMLAICRQLIFVLDSGPASSWPGIDTSTIDTVDRGMPRLEQIEKQLEDAIVELGQLLKATTEAESYLAYSVMALPDDMAKRNFAIDVLNKLVSRVPELIFIEILPPSKSDQSDRSLTKHLHNFRVIMGT